MSDETTFRSSGHAPPSHEGTPRGSRAAIPIIVIALLALALRLYALGAESLWMDELVTVDTYYHSLGRVIIKAAEEGQPPLDNLIGAGLARLGLADSDWWVRLPAAAFGAGGVLLLGVLVSRMYNGRAGLFAALLLAVCPLHVYMSQEVRPYALFFFLALATLLTFLRARRLQTIGGWILFSATMLATLMTRWVDPHFLAFGIVLYALAEYADRRRGHLRATLLAVLMAYVAYAPIFWIVLSRSTKAVAVHPTRTLARAADHLYEGFAALFAGYSTRTLFVALPASWLLLLIALGLASIGLLGIVRRLRKTGDAACGVFLAGVALFPFLYAVIFAMLGNALPKPQYLLFGAAAVFACVAIGIETISNVCTHHNSLMRFGFACVLCAGVGLPMARASAHGLRRADKQDWRGVMGYLRAHSSSEDAFAVIAADTVPPVFHVAPYGRARYGPQGTKFTNVHLGTDPTALEEAPGDPLTNAVWIIAYTDRMYRGHSKVTPPAGMHPDLGVHVFEGLFLLEVRGAGKASDRFRKAMAAVYEKLPERRSLIAPAFFLGRQALAGGTVLEAKRWFALAELQCRDRHEAAQLKRDWIEPAWAATEGANQHAAAP